jgi:hypothetical protein
MTMVDRMRIDHHPADGIPDAVLNFHPRMLAAVIVLTAGHRIGVRVFRRMLLRLRR